ncbi:MAG TPA: radical SAM family heme chaperone HemW [Gaiellaceae bacterium]|nr:radical SAM family heme chaperone HemW [Gaiellaceae bacterium]
MGTGLHPPGKTARGAALHQPADAPAAREAARRRLPEGRALEPARHLYVHLPFCAHRCGYCDFVTVVGRRDHHAAYVDALLAELELERASLAAELETVFLGGGTPTFTALPELLRLLRALPAAEEVTVEANPETVTAEVASALRAAGVTRVSLGAQSFQPRLLEVLDRVAGPDDVRRAVHHLRDAGFDNISLDLVYGIPGQSASDLDADLGAALELQPEHLSCYELEAKPGTRFTHAWGAELARQAEALEGYFERVVDRLTGSGYRWYETANFCRTDDAQGRDLRARHNLAYWLGRDYLGLGIGAVSTIENRRWRNTPRLGRYLAALAAGRAPEREVEPLDPGVRARERALLGLRLDQPLSLAGLRFVLDEAGLARMERLGLAVHEHETLALTRRGRFLGGAVAAELLI